jgi:hypothetical protein
MKAPSLANTERLNCKIRADIKKALEGLAARRHRAEGGYVGLTRIINEAGLLLLEREGIELDETDLELPPLAIRKPVRPVARRRAAARA